jgi:hypothetical protein
MNGNTQNDTVLPLKEGALYLCGCLKLRVIESKYGSSGLTA